MKQNPCGECVSVQCGRCGWKGRRSGAWATYKPCRKCGASWMQFTHYEVIHRTACPRNN